MLVLNQARIDNHRKYDMLPDLIAQVREANCKTLQESVEMLFHFIKMDKELYTKIADKLLMANCSDIMRNHYHSQSAVIWTPQKGTYQANHVAQVQKAAQAQSLHKAARALEDRLMNMPICAGAIRLGDATRADIYRHNDFMQKQIDTSVRKVQFLDMIATKLKDNQTVMQRFNEKDLQRLHAATVPQLIAAE